MFIVHIVSLINCVTVYPYKRNYKSVMLTNNIWLHFHATLISDSFPSTYYSFPLRILKRAGLNGSGIEVSFSQVNQGYCDLSSVLP